MKKRNDDRQVTEIDGERKDAALTLRDATHQKWKHLRKWWGLLKQ